MNKKFYIEVGANDGIFQSRSLCFYGNPEYQGILIEPNPNVFLECKKNRPLDLCVQAALVPFDYKDDEVTLFIHDKYSAQNGVRKFSFEKYPSEIRVPARTLQSILEENKIYEIEYFFLDVEGFEIDVLKGINFDKIIFKNIEIECHMSGLGISPEEETERFNKILENKYNLININYQEASPKAIFKYKYL